MQGYNPDWSGLLGATQQRGQVLGGIGQALGGMAKQSRLEEEQAQQKQLMQSEIQGAMQSNDPNKIAEVSLKYPQMSTAIKDAFGFTSGETEKNFKDTNFKILSNPENAPQYLQERVDYLDSIGADSSAPKARLQMQKDNPEQFIETTRGLTSATYPNEFTSWSSAMRGDDGGVAKTTSQKDFGQYQDLLKTDPEAAKQFGIKSGFVEPNKPKKLFQVRKNDDGTTTKYYSDGSEEIASATTKVKTPDMKAPMNQEQAMKIVDKAKEGQLKNAGFAITMNDGLSQVESMERQGYDPKSAAWVQSYLAGTTLGNLAMSDQDQVYVGAIEQMINAIARRETGAAITEFEKKDFFNRYMPAAGDSKSRIKQKKDALNRQFKSIRGQSGSVYDAIRVSQGMNGQKDAKPKQEAKRPLAAPEVGVVEGGYKFNGGDPKDPASWSKV